MGNLGNEVGGARHDVGERVSLEGRRASGLGDQDLG